MATDPTSDAVDAARYSAFMNGAYNADREGFLDGVHRWLMFAVIVFGATALTDLLDGRAVKLVTAIGALAGTFDLVFDLSTRARRHAVQRRLYFDLAAKLSEGSIGAREAEASMLKSAAEEDPPFYAALAVAENWADRAVYGDGRRAPCEVGFWYRLSRHLFRFEGRQFACEAAPPS